MKKFTFLFAFLFLFLSSQINYSQIFTENFDYPAGDSLSQHGWIAHSGSGFPFLVWNGNLSYPGYPESGIGNLTVINCGSGSRQDVHVEFAPVDTLGIYTSFLVEIDSLASTTGEYFFHYSENPWSNLFRTRVFARDDGSGNLQFGLSKASTSTVSWTTTTYSFQTTYLLVAKYEFIGDLSGSDDVVKLYINPDISNLEPVTPDLINSDTNTDIAIGSIALRQGSNNLSLRIDGIKVITNWDQIVPVELTSFSASAVGNNAVLNWTTATELNNSGFEIQRIENDSDFETIGFVSGYGTTTETRKYSYIDTDLNSGTYTYRLKQIDFDGTFTYSDEVRVEITGPLSFDLSQNYPNPFNPSTTISFSLPQSGIVKLIVYNLLGEKVAELANEFKEAGVHTINFNAESVGAGLQSGLYIYKIESNGFIQSRKMVLVK